MRLSELLDATIKTPDGEILGRVQEVHCDRGRVITLVCGPAGLVERLTGKAGGRRIAWKSVRKLNRDGLLVSFDSAVAQPSTKN